MGRQNRGKSEALPHGIRVRTIRAANLLYWPTGNPSPSNRGAGRAGDNLYSNSLLALDADTGKLKWYFQFTKHDEHDWDATQVPVMLDAGDKHLIVQANRNGFFYVLDRSTGKLISATRLRQADLERLQRQRGTAHREERRLPDTHRPHASVPARWAQPTSWPPLTVRRPARFI